MKSMLSATEKIKEFELMSARLSCLISLGFRPKGSKYIPNKRPAGESYEFLLGSDNDIFVEFTFYPATSDKDDYIVVYVIDDKAGKDFSLDAWVQKRRGISEKNPFKLSSYSGGFSQQLKEFEKFLDDLFSDSELKAVLQGREWIDVKFNWGEAK